MHGLCRQTSSIASFPVEQSSSIASFPVEQFSSIASFPVTVLGICVIGTVYTYSFIEHMDTAFHRDLSILTSSTLHSSGQPSTMGVHQLIVHTCRFLTSNSVQVEIALKASQVQFIFIINLCSSAWTWAKVIFASRLPCFRRDGILLIYRYKLSLCC